MPLESATYLNSLDSSNPVLTDSGQLIVPEFRLLKQVLLNTFPNATGPIGITTDSARGFTPVGGIIMWSGASTAIPQYWVLCNGATVNKSDGSGTIVAPDLRNRFIVGAGDAYTVAQTGGSTSHTHVVGIAGTALTKDQLPNYALTVTESPHTHALTDPGHVHPTSITSNVGNNAISNGSGGAGNTGSATTGITIAPATTGITVNSGGSGNTHTHTASCDTPDSRPPYYALCFIMRV